MGEPGFFDMLLLAMIARVRFPHFTDRQCALWAQQFCTDVWTRDAQISALMPRQGDPPLSAAQAACFRYAYELGVPGRRCYPPRGAGWFLWTRERGRA